MATTRKSKEPAKSSHPTVVSFRITDEQTKKLGEIFDRDGPVGVRSTNQYARKILSDFLANRLVYKNPVHRKKDLDLYPD
jgi:hypothetical protein